MLSLAPDGLSGAPPLRDRPALQVSYLSTRDRGAGHRFPGYEHAEHEVLHWIGFYNAERLHEELGDLPPVEYEELNIKTDKSRTLAAI